MPAAHSEPPVSRSRASAPGGKPDLRHVVPEDLADTGRLLELYEQAVGLGLVAASEWGRLRFVAAAEHARVIGTKNPCGLFVRLVRGGLWHFATYDDETTASVRLRRHLYGMRRRGGPRSRAAIRPRPELSDDARLVQAVREVAARAGLPGRSVPAAEAREAGVDARALGPARWSWAGEQARLTTRGVGMVNGAPRRDRRQGRRINPAGSPQVR